MTSNGSQDPGGSLWHVTSGERAPETVERLLRSLPEWFGIESSIAEYVEEAHKLPAYVAWAGSEAQVRGGEREAVGVLLVTRHFPGLPRFT